MGQLITGWLYKVSDQAKQGWETPSLVKANPRPPSPPKLRRSCNLGADMLTGMSDGSIYGGGGAKSGDGGAMTGGGGYGNADGSPSNNGPGL